jgi:hypothetical protein
MKTITLSGSMSFYREMKALQKELESLGYLVMTPCEE